MRNCKCERVEKVEVSFYKFGTVLRNIEKDWDIFEKDWVSNEQFWESFE